MTAFFQKSSWSAGARLGVMVPQLGGAEVVV